ncbi:hypothetical protein C8F04DRAFT_1100997 [Mycena alexandri]|uniref:Uncharacterized protein n=1 Tax=Mycena alexandri TaxID=1745969 RepID=A0AAD6SVE3_9AGAR|nr:hypothetical protein C8F04DRAFT_1100997 [Mycena alexandri]
MEWIPFLLAIIAIVYGCMPVLLLLQFDCAYKTPLYPSVGILWSIRSYCSLFILAQTRDGTPVPALEVNGQRHGRECDCAFRSTGRAG